MKKLFLIVLLSFLILNSQFSILKAQTWKEMMDSTNYYQEKQDFETALKWAKLALPQAEKEFGQKDTNYIFSLVNLSNCNKLVSNYEKAIELSKLALQLTREVTGEERIEYATILLQLGDMYKLTGRYSDAELLIKEALEKIKKISKGDSPELAQCMNNLASCYKSLGKFNEAGELFKESLDMARRVFKEDNVELVRMINNTALFYENIGYFIFAEPLYKEGVDMIKRIYKGDHIYVSQILMNIGMFYQGMGNFNKADTILKEVLDMNRRMYKGDNENLALSLHYLALSKSYQGKFTESEQLYKESLEMRRRLLQGDHLELIISLSNLGQLYLSQGKYSETEPLLLEALAMARRLNLDTNPEFSSYIMNGLGLLYLYQGRLKESEPLLKGALDKARQLYNSDNPNLAIGIGNLALLYFQQGRYSNAEPLFVESLEMMKHLYNSDNPNLSSTMSNLSAIQTFYGRYEEAEKLGKEALEMNRRIFQDPNQNLAQTINNMASIYTTMGRYNEAEILIKEALEVKKQLYKNEHPFTAISLANLAEIYHCQGKLSEAEGIFREAIEMGKRIYKSDHVFIASSMSYLATLLYTQNRLNEAESLCRNALDMFRSLSNNDLKELEQTLVTLATILRDQGKYDESEALSKESIDMAKRLYKNNHPDLNRNIFSLASLYEYQGKYKDAEPLFKESYNQTMNLVYRYFPHLSEKAKLDYWKSQAMYIIGFYNFGSKYYDQKPEIIGDMYDVTLATKGLVLNSTKNVLEQARHTTSLFENWKGTRELWLNLIQNPGKAKSMGFSIDSIEKSANEMEKEISQSSLGFKKVFDTTQYHWQDVQRKLGNGEAAVEIIKFMNIRMKVNSKDTIMYAALIVKKDSKSPEIVLLGNGNELDSNCLSIYRQAIEKQRKKELKQSGLEDLGELYRKFWAKIDEKLKGISKVYFSPDGVYHLVNVNTLLNPDTEKYVLDEKDIMIVTNTRDLVEEDKYRKEVSKNNFAALFGNPKFKLTTKNENKEKNPEKTYSFLSGVLSEFGKRGIEPLPGTKIEVEKISGYLKAKQWQVEPKIGSEAMEVALKSIKYPKILHIATHGMFLKDLEILKGVNDLEIRTYIENPLMRSMLLFSGAENTIMNPGNAESDNDGILTAYEVMNLNLDNTDLVVLSACETGYGEIHNSDGVYGMQRAFRIAGAKSLIMSLWSVSDQATQELMTNFYNKWLSGKTKREAFREAQMELKQKYPGFYYWGAFVMVGE